MSREIIKEEFTKACSVPSDINEHVDTIRLYASRCTSVVEMGVRSGVSTWGCLQGLAEAASTHSPETQLCLTGFDLDGAPDVYLKQSLANAINVTIAFIQGDVLKVAPVPTDMLFIDTFHVYGQLKRELALHAPTTRKYILMHDTTVDGDFGEAVRQGICSIKMSEATGIPPSEITIGLWPAITEFLAANRDWQLVHRFVNNNGLTILQRKTISRRAYVLTTDAASPRGVFSRNILESIGFDVSMVNSIPNVDKVLSNRSSMQTIYETIITSQDEWAYVFEDDINKLSDITLEEIVEYEAISSPFFYLGVCIDTTCTSVHPTDMAVRSHDVIKVSNAAGLHAIGISKQGATQLLEVSMHPESHAYMDRVLGAYSVKYPANVVRFDLESTYPGHRGVIFQDRAAFPSSIP